MALVFPHSNLNDGLVLSTTCMGNPNVLIGKFLGDGYEYLACVRDQRYIDFYLLPECYIKSKTIEVFMKDSEDKIDEIKLYHFSSELDYIVIEQNRWEHKCWNGTEITDFRGGVFLKFPGGNVAPGLFLNGDDRDGFEVCKENEVLLTRKPSNDDYSHLCLLDENTVAISYEVGRLQYNLDILSLNSNEVISKWEHNILGCIHGITVSYISKNDRSKVIVIMGSYNNHVISVVDISRPQADDITHEYNTDPGLDEDYDAELLFYDENTGCPVFHMTLKEWLYHTTLSIFRDGRFFNIVIGMPTHFCNHKLVLQGSNMYEIVSDVDKGLCFGYRGSLPAMERIEHSYRDLAGTAYIDINGVFRKSLTFSSTGILSNESVEPVKDIFWVGSDLVLISGETSSVVVNVNTTKEVSSWHKSERSNFASEKFQVCGPKIYTSAKEIDLPFSDATTFAQSGNSLVIGSATKVAIISQDLGIERIFDDEFIFRVFSDGYVASSGVKIFNNPELNVIRNDIIDVELVNGTLYTVPINGELRCGPDQEKVDLILERVKCIYKFGNSLLISDQTDTYLYSNGEYFSLEAGDYESILVSEDNSMCVTLNEGIVYAKTNIGFQMVKKKVGGVLNYGSVSVYNDKLMCRQVDHSTSQNTVIVKHIAGSITTSFQKPNVWGESDVYILFSEMHFLESNEKASVFQLSNPELEVHSFGNSVGIFTEMEWRTLPIAEGKNKLFLYYYNQYDTDYKEVFLFEDGNLESYKCHHVDHNSDWEDDDEEEEEYTLGVKVNDYPRSGNHWVCCEDWQNPNIRLVPKSEETIMTSDISIAYSSDSTSGIRAENDSETYYCAHATKVYKVPVGGAQQEIAKINTAERNGAFPAKYTVNHGLKTKYEPDFIITYYYPVTITILSPEKAEKLQAVQLELIGDKQNSNVISEIDGRFLLLAAMDSKNEVFFTKHGIDVEELKNGLWDLFK